MVSNTSNVPQHQHQNDNVGWQSEIAICSNSAKSKITIPSADVAWTLGFHAPTSDPRSQRHVFNTGEPSRFSIPTPAVSYDHGFGINLLANPIYFHPSPYQQTMSQVLGTTLTLLLNWWVVNLASSQAYLDGSECRLFRLSVLPFVSLSPQSLVPISAIGVLYHVGLIHTAVTIQ